MLFAIEQGRLIKLEENSTQGSGTIFISVAGTGDKPSPPLTAYVPEPLWKAALMSSAVRFESHDKLDVLCISCPSSGNGSQREKAHIFIGTDWVQFICRQPGPVLELLEAIAAEGEGGWTVGRLLHRLFERFSHSDADHLDALEGEIAALENTVLSGKTGSEYIKEIVRIRRHLIALKRRYEQLQDVVEDILGNENGLFDSQSLKYFKIYDSKVDRLYNHVVALQEYVTEIRDAYQAQVDISLNGVMKFFTVITSVFLPLTLLAGWYGMNLNMPEYRWEWGYPVLIAVSVLIVVAEVIYFKRHKWF